ncbi:MAG: translation-associated GTPase, partial [Alphaproteobacteria bacterium]
MPEPKPWPTALIVTAAAVFWWGALVAASRVVLLRYGLDPWAFSFIQLCAGGVLLLLLGGRRSLALASFRRPATWALGVLRVASAALYTAVLAWVSALEAGTIGAVSL